MRAAELSFFLADSEADSSNSGLQPEGKAVDVATLASFARFYLPFSQSLRQAATAEAKFSAWLDDGRESLKYVFVTHVRIRVLNRHQFICRFGRSERCSTRERSVGRRMMDLLASFNENVQFN
jgi:hypothetical protein